MKFIELLGKFLKDDDVIEVLEHYDMRVIYDFDRTHENIDDIYWAAAKELGFQLRFDKDQRLTTVFFYISAREGFSPIDRALLDVPIFESFDEAQSASVSQGLPHKASPGEPGSKTYKWWIRLEFGPYTVHYQFKEGKLVAVTLSSK